MPVSGVTTPGKLFLSRVLPGWQGEPLDKRGLSNIFQSVAEKTPEKYPEIIQDLITEARRAVYLRGNDASIGLDDMIPPPEVVREQDRMRADVRKISQDPNLSGQEKNRRIEKYMLGQLGVLDKTLAASEAAGSSMAKHVRLGFRGDKFQHGQIVIGDLMVADPEGRPIPVPGLRGYGEGLSPLNHLAGAYAARKGGIDVQFATSDTGYFGKLLTSMAHRAVVTERDCGAKGVGLFSDGGDPDNLGSVLAAPAEGIPAGTTIDRKILSRLSGKEVLVRSPQTCRLASGVCQKCTGMRDARRFPPIGSYVGISSGRITAEPMIQGLALSSKHLGGMAGINSENLSAFQQVAQTANVPETYVGGAPVAGFDARVQGVREAPQGGWNVTLQAGDREETSYVPGDQKPVVKVGQTLEAGDVLSNGEANPRDIAIHKGIGEGRRYFAKLLNDTLKLRKVETSRKNTDVLAREFINRVQITNPEGYAGYDHGDIVGYNELQAGYAEEPDSRELEIDKAAGKYLQYPVLHYTIGTRMTPRMLAEVKSRGMDRVRVSDTSPGFTPVVTRLMDFAGKDREWMARAGGWGLRKSITDAAATGSTVPANSTSYTRKMFLPEELHEDESAYEED